MGIRKASKTDRALREVFPRGAWLDLRSGDAEVDKPANAAAWGSDRTVRAEVINGLLLGDFSPELGCFPAVRIRGARIAGRLDLMGATIRHALVCEGCWFDQPPRLVETSTKTVRIISSRMPGFNGARMRTEGLLNLYGSAIEGLLRLDRAHVAGEIFLMGVRVGDGTGEAIAAEGLIVDGDMQCNGGFTARGTINLRGARIGGRLRFQDSVLDAPESELARRSGLHLSLLRAGELDLRAAQPVIGGIRLSNAHVGTLGDNPAVWPRDIWLNGFTYDSIRPRTGRVLVPERLDWLSRDTLGYRPQPYEQLAAFYRRTGHDDDARRVLLAKQRHRRTTLKLPGKILGWLLDWTVGYGYRPWLAAIWLAALLAAGTTVFSTRIPHMVHGGPAPPFNAFIYTLDLLIPIGAFGLRNSYASTAGIQWLADALIAAGWILASAVIAGITRTVHRD